MATVKAFWNEEFLPLLWRTAAALIGLLIGLGAIWLFATGVGEWFTEASSLAQFRKEFSYSRIVLTGMAPQLVLASALGPWLGRTRRRAQAKLEPIETTPIQPSIPEIFVSASLAYCAIAPAVAPASSSGQPIQLILLYLGMTGCVSLALAIAARLPVQVQSEFNRQEDRRHSSARDHGGA
ncbi:MAG: hypothetical protein CBC48_15695 [bacterium TMED88]|nr:hypothetical protein [Deltaproteobacteria bacterium]OUV26166.1 MAG: hypothetical protein CBC48_15695 [bacterium TMED88]